MKMTEGVFETHEFIDCGYIIAVNELIEIIQGIFSSVYAGQAPQTSPDPRRWIFFKINLLRFIK